MISSPILELSHLYFGFDPGPPLLNDISFELQAGETLGVIGPNGGGKSTLLKLMAGLLSAQRGHIYIEGKLVEKEKNFPFASIGLVPQSSTLNHLMPVSPRDLLQMQQQIDQKKGKKAEAVSEVKERQEILQLVGLEHKADALISSLSGGEKQRVLLARALIKRPKLLLLDEPFTGLDSTGQDQLVGLLKKIKQENNTTIVLVDHNLTEVIKNCDRIICLNKKVHWHNHKELLTKSVLESMYHCEFEHLLLHESLGHESKHTPCADEHVPGHHKGKHHHSHGNEGGQDE